MMDDKRTLTHTQPYASLLAQTYSSFTLTGAFPLHAALHATCVLILPVWGESSW